MCKIVYKLYFSRSLSHERSAIISTATSEGARYNVHRAYQSIGTSSQASLKEYIRAVANFAQLIKTTEQMLLLEIYIESFALRRRLSQELQGFYKDTNLIFT